MKELAVLVICVLCSFSGFGQDNSGVRKFSDTEKAIIRYRTLTQQAWEANNEKLALSYMDSVKISIVGSYVDSHTFKTMGDKKVSLESLKKPVLLITSATWCAPCIGEILALNKVAEEYSDRVDFLVLFHDAKNEKLEKVVKQYGNAVSVVASEKKEEDPHTLDIAGFRHITGYPTNYSIDRERRIIAYSQGAAVARTYDNGKGETITITKERADELNYIRLKEEVEHLITKSY
ncbi:TlpA family protein disulfide reductase [Pontibacter pudoricolor]|uniref:TlpA family protein disulfide reductase n=1 Tax=Pontibacter pudoricolor TaxID=2694930 RepID=UPI001391A4ED|nr:TlpA disulfide reductase family protein [Pontibacter pudoricolor]